MTPRKRGKSPDGGGRSQRAVLQSLSRSPVSCPAARPCIGHLASLHDLFFFPGSPDTNTWSRPRPNTRTRLSSPRSCSSSRPSSSPACLIPTHLSQIRAPRLHPTRAGTHARSRRHTSPLSISLCSRLSVRSTYGVHPRTSLPCSSYSRSVQSGAHARDTCHSQRTLSA